LVIASAQRSGLLPAPPEHLALTYGGSGAGAGEPLGRPEGLKRVLEELAKLEDPRDKAERHRQARMEAEEARKAEIQEQVLQYERTHRAA